ncbi:MAG: hypothetical protein Fur0046_15180 [Cyanobacteria bacterium J069]
MAFWEFLIQQEGDRSWLPLESPDVEILEGRYRVVARSSRVNTPVEISIIQTLLSEHPPRRRVQKRAGQTNRDGLLVVMPFTRLEPGAWELRCVGDLMSDLMGDGWGYGVKLQVLGHEADLDGDDDLLPEDWHSSIAISDSEVSEPKVSELEVSELEVSELEVSELEAPGLSEVAASAAIAPSQAPDSSLELALSAPAESQIESQTDSPAVELSFLDALESAQATPEVPVSKVPEAAPRLAGEQDLSKGLPATIEELEAGSTEHVQTEHVPVLEPLAQSVAAISPAELPPLRLVLNPNHYAARWGSTLQLVGQVEAADNESEQALPDLTLELTLRDPQSGDVLVRVGRELQGGTLPLAVDCAVEIPNVDTTRLMLGEVALCYDLGADQEPFLLAVQSFTVTAALDDLLEAIANDFPADLTSPFVEEEEIDLSLLNLVDGHPSGSMLLPETRPAGDQVLPPQIFQPASQAADQPAAKSVELPPWGNPLPGFENGLNLWQLAATVSTGQSNVTRLNPEAAPAHSGEPDSSTIAPTGELTDSLLPDSDAVAADWVDEVADFAEADFAAPPETVGEAAIAPADDSDLSIYLTTVNRSNHPKPPASPPPASPEQPPTPEPAPNAAAPPAADPADAPLEWNHEALSLGQPAPLPSSTPRFLSPEDRAFQALNLQRRFLSRLTALAADSELGTLMQPGAAPLGRDLDLATDEIVVEDEPLPPPQRSSLYRLEHAPEPPPVILSADEPVPSPTLDVPTGELTSGQRIELGIALPDLEPRFYIKLWLRDRQSRAVLDGPRWVMNFSPDGQGYQIAYTQVTVPFGCVETQFEAIAVEMSTQRESHKVVQSRRVVPPNLPQLDLNDLGI